MPSWLCFCAPVGDVRKRSLEDEEAVCAPAKQPAACHTAPSCKALNQPCLQQPPSDASTSSASAISSTRSSRDDASPRQSLDSSTLPAAALLASTPAASPPPLPRSHTSPAGGSRTLSMKRPLSCSVSLGAASQRPSPLGRPHSASVTSTSCQYALSMTVRDALTGAGPTDRPSASSTTAAFSSVPTDLCTAASAPPPCLPAAPPAGPTAALAAAAAAAMPAGRAAAPRRMSTPLLVASPLHSAANSILSTLAFPSDDEGSVGGGSCPATPTPNRRRSLIDCPAATHACTPEQLLEGLTGLTYLSRGGMGSVYTGFWLSAPTAVKFVVSATEAAAGDSAREALVSMRACHPNCVQTYWCRTAQVDAAFLAAAAVTPLRPSIDVAPGRPADAALCSQLSDVLGGPSGRPDTFDNPGHSLLGVAKGGGAQLADILSDLGAKVGHFLLIIGMEWCDGGSLAGTIHAGFFKPSAKWSARLTQRSMLRTACEVAKGMLHLHSCGIAHRDLKPANVLLRGTRLDRRGFVAKVADFGLARDSAACETTPGTPVWSTLDYMAPERFSGHGSTACDVWAFGVLLHTLWTGEQPYGHLPPGAVSVAVQEGTLRPEFPAGAPAALVTLAQECWVLDPTLRPTFAVIIDRLRAIEDDIRNESQHKLVPMGDSGAMEIV